MRDSIARALVWALRLLLPARGRHRTAQPAPASVTEPAPTENPWMKPWTGPSSAEVREIFRAEETMRLTPVQRERSWAAEFAARGVDYDYRYPGDHFAQFGVSA
ncbi:hypothetical protein OG241_22425 [Streptomyces sp. NBC_01390]|uniref:hypothetical protein n=1 Tax=Streptomyces sp. NBC_01390 TaxID=2903850 RepID=UPI0032483A22